MNKTSHKQSGLAAIEFTLVLPFILLLIFATAEFGRLLYQYNALNKSVRDAARFLSSSARPGSTEVIDITSGIESQAKNLVIYGHAGTGSPLLPNLAPNDIAVSASEPFITIRVVYPWRPIFSDTLTTFGFGNDIDLSFPLVSTYTMRAL